MTKAKSVKTVFVSDIHLGTRGCQAEKLIQFLKSYDCEELYLVGDIIDGWRMQRKFHWPQSHSEVIRQILKKAQQGTNVYYVVGNHDEFLRKWLSWDLSLGRIKFTNRHVYVSKNGKRYLVVHGDMFDNFMKANLKWLMHLGDFLYNLLIWVNQKLNRIRTLLKRPPWSLSKYLKSRTKQAVSFINNYEQKLSQYALSKEFDGVVCGHIHQARNSYINGVHYLNSGDWVDSCTAIIETHQGEFEIVEW